MFYKTVSLFVAGESFIAGKGVMFYKTVSANGRWMEMRWFMDTTEVGIVWVTFPHAEAATVVIDGLLEHRLAACVQTMPVQSVYRWKGAVNRDAEVLALIKTKVSLYPEVEAFIRSRHSYEVSEILLLPITAGFSGYLQWVGNETKKGGAPEGD